MRDSYVLYEDGMLLEVKCDALEDLVDVRDYLVTLLTLF